MTYLTKCLLMTAFRTCLTDSFSIICGAAVVWCYSLKRMTWELCSSMAIKHILFLKAFLTLFRIYGLTIQLTHPSQWKLISCGWRNHLFVFDIIIESFIWPIEPVLVYPNPVRVLILTQRHDRGSHFNEHCLLKVRKSLYLFTCKTVIYGILWLLKRIKAQLVI